jgi:hypothetical protein
LQQPGLARAPSRAYILVRCSPVQAPATQAALKAGIPSSVPCTLINKVCSSGLKAVVLAAQTILAGETEGPTCLPALQHRSEAALQDVFARLPQPSASTGAEHRMFCFALQVTMILLLLVAWRA